MLGLLEIFLLRVLPISEKKRGGVKIFLETRGSGRLWKLLEVTSLFVFWFPVLVNFRPWYIWYENNIARDSCEQTHEHIYNNQGELMIDFQDRESAWNLWTIALPEWSESSWITLSDLLCLPVSGELSFRFVASPISLFLWSVWAWGLPFL